MAAILVKAETANPKLLLSLLPELLEKLDYFPLVSDRLSSCLASGKLASSEIEAVKALQIKLGLSVPPSPAAIEIAAFGLVSRGKTAVLNALMGKKIWETGPAHGVTQTVASQQMEAWETRADGSQPKVRVKLIDTPGLDEVDGECRAEMAAAIARQVDLVLFVIAGDLTRLELETLEQLSQAYKPILLVFNKIDLYPDGDRAQIRAALQSERMQQLISENEIIFTAAEPLPTRVRLQYADSEATEEVWEKTGPQVQFLKARILDLLNREGKSLLAINALRALAEIEDSATERHLQSLPPLRPAAAAVFTLKAIALGISPWFWLDAAIGGAIDSVTFAFWVRGYTLLQPQLWWGAIAVNALCLAGLGLEAQLAQIGWVGISLPVMLYWLQVELHRSSGLGVRGAKTLMEKIIREAPTDSILSRIAGRVDVDRGADLR